MIRPSSCFLFEWVYTRRAKEAAKEWVHWIQLVVAQMYLEPLDPHL